MKVFKNCCSNNVLTEERNIAIATESIQIDFLQRVKRVAMFDKGQSTSIRESQICNFFPAKIKAKVIRKCLANREMRMPHDWFTTSNFNLLK